MTHVQHLATEADCRAEHDGMLCGPHVEHLEEPFDRDGALARIDREWLYVQDEYWLTKDGTKVQIVAMDDRHLANTIMFLRRRLAGKQMLHNRLRVGWSMAIAFSGLGLSGDMSTHLVEREEARLWHQVTSSIGGIPLFRAMVVEHTRRLIRARRARMRAPVPTASF